MANKGKGTVEDPRLPRHASNIQDGQLKRDWNTILRDPELREEEGFDSLEEASQAFRDSAERNENRKPQAREGDDTDPERDDKGAAPDEGRITVESRNPGSGDEKKSSPGASRTIENNPLYIMNLSSDASSDEIMNRFRELVSESRHDRALLEKYERAFHDLMRLENRNKLDGWKDELRAEEKRVLAEKGMTLQEYREEMEMRDILLADAARRREGRQSSAEPTGDRARSDKGTILGLGEFDEEFPDDLINPELPRDLAVARDSSQERQREAWIAAGHEPEEWPAEQERRKEELRKQLEDADHSENEPRTDSEVRTPDEASPGTDTSEGAERVQHRAVLKRNGGEGLLRTASRAVGSLARRLGRRRREEADLSDAVDKIAAEVRARSERNTGENETQAGNTAGERISETPSAFRPDENTTSASAGEGIATAPKGTINAGEAIDETQPPTEANAAQLEPLADAAAPEPAEASDADGSSAEPDETPPTTTEDAPGGRARLKAAAHPFRNRADRKNNKKEKEAEGDKRDAEILASLQSSAESAAEMVRQMDPEGTLAARENALDAREKAVEEAKQQSGEAEVDAAAAAKEQEQREFRIAENARMGREKEQQRQFMIAENARIQRERAEDRLKTPSQFRITENTTLADTQDAAATVSEADLSAREQALQDRENALAVRESDLERIVDDADRLRQRVDEGRREEDAEAAAISDAAWERELEESAARRASRGGPPPAGVKEQKRAVVERERRANRPDRKLVRAVRSRIGNQETNDLPAPRVLESSGAGENRG